MRSLAWCAPCALRLVPPPCLPPHQAPQIFHQPRPPSPPPNQPTHTYPPTHTPYPPRSYLVIKRPWPSMMRTVAGDHARFEQTYFSHYKGYYFTGDGARRDEDG